MDCSKTFLPIHSANCVYEINIRGTVRNARTKRVLKTHSRGANDRYVFLYFNGRKTTRSVRQLLWEVHGSFDKRIRRPIPVTVCYLGAKFRFNNLAAAARFLAPKIYYTVSYIANMLCHRKPSFAGATFTYHNLNF